MATAKFNAGNWMGPANDTLPDIRPARTDLHQRHYNALVFLLEASPMIRLQQPLPVIT